MDINYDAILIFHSYRFSRSSLLEINIKHTVTLKLDYLCTNLLHYAVCHISADDKNPKIYACIQLTPLPLRVTKLRVTCAIACDLLFTH